MVGDVGFLDGAYRGCIYIYIVFYACAYRFEGLRQGYYPNYGQANEKPGKRNGNYDATVA